MQMSAMSRIINHGLLHSVIFVQKPGNTAKLSKLSDFKCILFSSVKTASLF